MDGAILTVPRSKVPIIRCASGAQCKPARTAILYRLFRYSDTFSLSQSLILKDMTGADGRIMGSAVYSSTSEIDDSSW